MYFKIGVNKSVSECKSIKFEIETDKKCGFFLYFGFFSFILSKEI